MVKFNNIVITALNEKILDKYNFNKKFNGVIGNIL